MKTFIGFILLLASSFAFGQADPVKWTIAAERIADDEFEVSFTAKIESGWSIYSPEAPRELGPIPTTFSFDDDSGVKLVGNPHSIGHKKEIFDQMFGTKVTRFLNRARFTQRIKVNSDTTVIKGLVSYMSCDATSCLPPADLPFEIDLH